MRLFITQTPNSPITLDAQNRRVFPAQISFEGTNTYPLTCTLRAFTLPLPLPSLPPAAP